MEEHRSRVAEEKLMGVSEKTGMGWGGTKHEWGDVKCLHSSVGEDEGKKPFG